MAASSAVCHYGGYEHRPSLPLQLLSRSPPVCLGSILNSWTLRGERKDLPSSYPPPSWYRNPGNRVPETATRSPPAAFKVLTVKRSHPEFGVTGARIEVLATCPFELAGSPLPRCRINCGQFVEAATSAERGASVGGDEYDGGDCEYYEWEDEEEASQGDDDCSGDEFNDSGCQYVIDEDDECDEAAVQFVIDALSNDDDGGGDDVDEEGFTLEDPNDFETSRTPLMSHLSVESGYVENLSDSACTPDTCTTEDEFDDFDESDCECTDPTDADSLWKSFEQQTFFVADCGKMNSTCKQPLPPLQIKRPPSPPLVPKCNTQNVCGPSGCDGNGDISMGEGPTLPPCCGSARRHVTFKPDSELVVVHHMITWNFAYRSCRKGPWEQYVIDRDHFRRRVEEFGKIFQPCFAKRKQQLQPVS